MNRFFTNLVTILGTKRVRTTAYGLVERFHGQLKAVLTAHGDTTKWTEALPLVLHGIRTAVKADLQCSAAEKVFGTPLRVPGKFFQSAPAHQWPDPRSYAQRFSLNMSQLRPVRAYQFEVLLTRISSPRHSPSAFKTRL